MGGAAGPACRPLGRGACSFPFVRCLLLRTGCVRRLFRRRCGLLGLRLGRFCIYLQLLLLSLQICAPGFTGRLLLDRSAQLLQGFQVGILRHLSHKCGVTTLIRANVRPKGSTKDRAARLS